MSADRSHTVMPVQLDDFADRVAAFQNLYKDLVSAHPCAHLFTAQLSIVGTAISDLSDQARLASLYGQATLRGREQIMEAANRAAQMDR